MASQKEPFMHARLTLIMQRLSSSAVALTLVAIVTATAYAGELIDNGGMEEPLVNGLAHGWQNNSWGKNSATFSAGPPHTGKSSQQVACHSFQSGAVQLFYPLRIAAGKHYKVSLWLRAEGPVGIVNVGLRRHPEPYTLYLTASFEAGERWEQYTLEGDIPQSDEQAGLFVWCTPDAKATLWVDDVSVVESDLKPVELPLPVGNVVPNADFELALDRDWQCPGAEPLCDAEKPFHGQHSLRWQLENQSVTLSSRAIEFSGSGRQFTLALAARATGQASVVAEVWLAAMIGAHKPLLRLECQPGPEWKVFRSSGSLPASGNGAYFLRVHVTSRQRASVWLDAVRLEPGSGETPFRCRRPVEATLSCTPLAHIYREGMPIGLGVRAFCDGAGPRSCTLLCRVTDYWRNPVAEIPVQLDLKPTAATSARIQVPLKKTGVYLAELVDGQEVLSGLSFSVLPQVSRVPAERSIVGGHFKLDKFHMQAANAMGIKWTRIHDCESITHWNTVEPEKGHFVWHDDRVHVAREHGVQILGEFLRVPGWASSAGDEVKGFDVHQCPPRDLGEFAAYVRAVVGHYHNDIRYWEIWNEPYWMDFWRGTPEQCAELAKVAAREVRAVDPQATVLAPCTHPDCAKWIQTALAAGMVDGVHVFGYHGYNMLLPSGYKTVRDWAAFGRGKPLPIWNTETGTTSQTFYRHIPDRFADDYTRWLGNVSYRTAAELSAKYFALAIAGGAQRYFQYWSVYEESLPRLSAWSLFEYDTSLRPMGVAYAVAASLLDGCRGRGLLEVPGNVLACLVEDDQRLIAVAWRRQAARSLMFVIPMDPRIVEVRNMMGNPVELKSHRMGFTVDIGPEPLYLIVSGRHAASLMEALKNANLVGP
jgi:hypothetical protein